MEPNGLHGKICKAVLATIDGELNFHLIAHIRTYLFSFGLMLLLAESLLTLLKNIKYDARKADICKYNLDKTTGAVKWETQGLRQNNFMWQECVTFYSRNSRAIFLQDKQIEFKTKVQRYYYPIAADFMDRTIIAISNCALIPTYSQAFEYNA